MKTVWIAVALMGVDLSCMSAPESSNAPADSFATVEMQARAAAALAAAEDSSPAPAQDAAPVSAPASVPAKAVVTARVSTNVDGVLTNGMDDLDDTYKLAVGDSINFQILEDEGSPQPLSVEDSGDVEIPYIGRYPAAGKTCKGLAKELKKELEKKYYYQATVIISVNIMITHGVVYVVGGVKSPGPLEMPRDDVLTVSKAILRAGGFDDFADQERVRVTRKSDGGTNEVMTVNVADVLDKGRTAEDVQAKPGDWIYVREKVVHF